MSLSVLLTYLCVLVTTISGCIYGAWRKKYACEEYLPITLFAIIAALYIGGIMRQLTLTVYLIMIAAGIISLGFLVWMICRDGFSSLKRLLTPGLILYLILFGFLALTQSKMVSAEPDEASHWMDVIRAMRQTNTFGFVTEARCYFGNYPPAFSLIEYFAISVGSMLSGQMIEPLAFLAFQLFALSLFVSTLLQRNGTSNNWKRGGECLLATIAYFTFTLIFDKRFFSHLSVDSMVGLLAGFCFAYPLLGLEAGHRKVTYLFSLFVLCLAKVNGVLFAASAAMTHGVLGWLDNKTTSNSVQKNRGRMTLLAIGVVIVSWASWQILLAVHRPLFSEPWNEPFVLERLLQRLDVIRAFLVHLFTSSISFGFVSLPAVCFVPLLFMGIFIVMGKTKHSYTGRKRWVYLCCVSVLAVVYMAVLCLSYLLLFSDAEANALGSIDRYSGTLWQMLSFLLFALLLQWLSQMEKAEKKRWLAVSFAVMLLIFPFDRFNHIFVSGKSMDEAHVKRDHYDTVAAQVIDAIPQQSAEIFLVSQQTTHRDDFWFLRSLIRPHRIDNHNFNLALEGPLDENGIPCITKASYEQGMSAEISSQRWQEMLLESYDYVLLYHLSPTFAEDYGTVFEERETIAEYSLYQVLDDGTLRYVSFE